MAVVRADGAGGGPRSTESREENEGKLWLGGGERNEVPLCPAVMLCVAKKCCLLSSGH